MKREYRTRGGSFVCDMNNNATPQVVNLQATRTANAALKLVLGANDPGEKRPAVRRSTIVTGKVTDRRYRGDQTLVCAAIANGTTGIGDWTFRG